jgi:hypothetical protein
MLFLRLNYVGLGERKFVKENSFWNNADSAVNWNVGFGV